MIESLDEIPEDIQADFKLLEDFLLDSGYVFDRVEEIH